MNRLRIALGAVVIILLAACGGRDSRVEDARPVPVWNGKSARSDSFNRSFARLLNSYYALADGFVQQQPDTGIVRLAANMELAADSLAVTELAADTLVLQGADMYRMALSAELKGLIGETQPDARRKAFQLAGEQLYELVKLVRYDQAVIYRHYCPMAFNDQGADWLSWSPVISNPYLPGKMPGCGEIKDSIDFRIK